MALFGKNQPNQGGAPPAPPAPPSAGTQEGAAGTSAAPSTPTSDPASKPPVPTSDSTSKPPSASTPIPAMAIRAVPAGGFWRAGRHWTQEVQVVDRAEFDASQIQALRSESNLVVEDVEITPEPEA